MSDDTRDDPLGERTLLVSAYLDGDVTPAERTRVEADPALLADVERLRAVRAAMLDRDGYGAPAEPVRESAIRAALDAWDAVAHVAAAAVTAPRVLRFERRRSVTRWLGAAAAAVAVVGLGVVLTQVDGDTDDAGGDAASISLTADTDASAESADDTASDGTDHAPTAAGGAEPPEEATERDEAGDVAAEVTTVAEAPAATEAPAGTLAASQFSVVQMESPEELAAFAAEAMQAVPDSQGRDIFTTSCGSEEPTAIVEYVSAATYQGRRVVIGVDETTAFAIDVGTCEIVAEAPLP